MRKQQYDWYGKNIWGDAKMQDGRTKEKRWIARRIGVTVAENFSTYATVLKITDGNRWTTDGSFCQELFEKEINLIKEF